MHDCPLCIKNNLLTESIINESSGAYLIKAKSSPGNYLIVPKIHTESPLALPDDWWQHFKRMLSTVPGLKDYNISLNRGKPAGQTVKHIHFWIIPRIAGQPANGKGLAKLINEASVE